jgi:hypothetical protein
MKYIDAEKLKELLDAKYKEFRERGYREDAAYYYFADGLDVAKQLVESLQQEQPTNIDNLCSELADFLIRNDIQEDKAKFFANRIVDICGSKMYIDGLCDGLDANKIDWQRNTNTNKPPKNHSILMKTTHGIAEGEWNGNEWIQYRWSAKVQDSDVYYWLHLEDLVKLEKEGDIPYQEQSGVDLENKFEWHNISEETPEFGDTIIVACKNKNKEDGIWLYDLIQCWEGKWEPRENWETPLKWISVDELGLNVRKEK